MVNNERSGILAEYSQRVRERDIKREKRKTAVQAVKYFFCAASAGVLQLLTALLLRHLILEKFIDEADSINFITNLNKITFIADTVGLCVSILWNFTLNRKFTFKSANNIPLAMFLAFLFYIPFYPFQIWYIDTVEKSIAGSVGEAAFFIAQGTCMLINFALEFLWQKFVVFRQKKTPKKEEGALVADDSKDENTNDAVLCSEAEQSDGGDSVCACEKAPEDGKEKIAAQDALSNSVGSDSKPTSES